MWSTFPHRHKQNPMTFSFFSINMIYRLVHVSFRCLSMRYMLIGWTFFVSKPCYILPTPGVNYRWKTLKSFLAFNMLIQRLYYKSACSCYALHTIILKIKLEHLNAHNNTDPFWNVIWSKGIGLLQKNIKPCWVICIVLQHHILQLTWY